MTAMRLSKRLLKHPRTQSLLAWLLSVYIRLVYITSRRVYVIDPQAEQFMSGADNAIFAFWHGRMMMCPTIEPPGRKMHVLISHHRDGVLISKVIGHFGEATISGSSSRGGSAAVKEILRCLKKGDNISITPDGPRGPSQVAQMGIVTVARLTGRKVIPVTFSASKHRRFKSWDCFMLALPFGKIAFCVGAPLLVSREADDEGQEASRLEIEQAMNRLVETADVLTSPPPPEGEGRGGGTPRAMTPPAATPPPNPLPQGEGK